MRIRPVGRCVTLMLLIGFLVTAMALPAMAAWSTPGTGSGRSASATVNGGNPPTAVVSGSTVTLTWAASTMSNGAPVSGYIIKRYDSGGTVPQSVSAGSCDALVTGTSCAHTGVPFGFWSYSVTPVRGNWAGAESAKTVVFVLTATAPPAPTITSGPSDDSRTTAATFTFTDSEQGVTFQCQLDGGAFAACTTPKTYTGLSQGGHTFQVRAVNVFGQVSPATADSWTIDSVGPSIGMTFPVSGGKYSSPQWESGCGTPTGDLCGTATDAGSGVASVRISLRIGTGNYWNGTGFSSVTEVLLTPVGTTSWSYAFPAANFPDNVAYTVRVVVTDVAGNSTTLSTIFTRNGQVG